MHAVDPNSIRESSVFFRTPERLSISRISSERQCLQINLFLRCPVPLTKCEIAVLKMRKFLGGNRGVKYSGEMPTPQFMAAMQDYAEAVRSKYSVSVAANAEDQLKTPVENLLRALIPLVLSPPVSHVEILTEVQDDAGRPDVGVVLGGLLTGHIELKAPHKSADPNRLTGHDKQQWEKFQALPNLIYTNGSEWRLFQRVDTGTSIELKPIGKPVELGDLPAIGATGLDTAMGDAFQTLLTYFLNWEPVIPGTPKKLAQLLAPLTLLIRQDVRVALNDVTSNVHAVSGEWRQTLFPEADDARFADAYAQTVTYALLLARMVGSPDADPDHAARALQAGHPLLADILTLLTNNALRRELGVGLNVLIRVIDALDVTVFGGTGDPWLYFYEDFLAQYDPKLRSEYGVYYTPQEVIAAQVRLADELLTTHLGKKRGFASEGVIVLDPAAGTGAYPLRIIEHATTKHSKLGKATVATRVASQLYAIEILVGPYAVGRLRVTQAITRSNGTLPLTGAQVYLGDTLDSPHASIPGGLGFVYKPLTDERKRVQQLKNSVPVLVCIGNPPYRRWPAEDHAAGVRYGGWVRHGDEVQPGELQSPPLLNSFIQPVQAAGNGRHLKNLYNDYVAFWRWAIWKVFENKVEGESAPDRPGLVSFITASSYLRGPAFAGMREAMRRTFDHLWIIDLGGNGRGAVVTENVFAITTPVCIAIGLRVGPHGRDSVAKVKYHREDGTREQKLAFLDGLQRIGDVPWKDCPMDLQAPLMPRGASEYWSWPGVKDLFPIQRSGVKVGRTWPIGETRDILKTRWEALLGAPAEQRKALFKDSGTGRKISMAASRLKTSLPVAASKAAPLSLKPGAPQPPLVRYGFRSFDRMWLMADHRMLDRSSPELWRAHGPKQVYMVSLLTEQLGEGAAATVSSHIPDLHAFRGSYGGQHVIPLYLDADATLPNIHPELLDVLEECFDFTVRAEDVFAYTYALLATPSYEKKFREVLTIPGPRVPITRSGDLFREVVAAGEGLLHLHTYGERFGATSLPEGSAGVAKDIPGDPASYPVEFRYRAVSQTIHVGSGEISGVTEAVWNFSVSGLKVVQSWLAYRMKEGAGRQTGELSKLRLERWAPELTEELLELLWLVEATLDAYPTLNLLLERVLSGDVLGSDELPALEQMPEPVTPQDDSQPVLLDGAR